MEDMERYGDYNEYEDDVPYKKSPVGIVLKVLVALVCLSVVAVLAFRLILFNRYPDSMKNIYFDSTLTDYYYSTDGNISAEKQSLRAGYDDADDGNFFCDNLIVIRGVSQLQLSVRFNVSFIDALNEKYGVELDSDDADLLSFSLSVKPVDVEGAEYVTTGELSYVGTDKMLMYRYYKLVFNGVDFSSQGSDKVWIRLEINVNGAETDEPYMILVYENTDDYSKFEEYKLSEKEKPQT